MKRFIAIIAMASMLGLSVLALSTIGSVDACPPTETPPTETPEPSETPPTETPEPSETPPTETPEPSETPESTRTPEVIITEVNTGTVNPIVYILPGGLLVALGGFFLHKKKQTL